MEAPERIWLDWPDANRGDVVYDEPPERDTQPGQTEYIRKDASDAAIAAVRAEGVREGMLKARAIALADEANDWTDGVPRGGIIAEAIDDAMAAEAQP